MITPLCGRLTAISAPLLACLLLTTSASAASLAGLRSADSPVAGTLVEKAGHRGGFYLSIGPGYYYDDDDYGYGATYGYYGYYPRYGGYYYDDDDDDDDYDDYPHYYGGRRWVKERFEHPLGRR